MKLKIKNMMKIKSINHEQTAKIITLKSVTLKNQLKPLTNRLSTLKPLQLIFYFLKITNSTQF